MPDNITIVDNGYEMFHAPKTTRSIRFKGNSFSVISRVWNNFRTMVRNSRINSAENKLEAAKQDFVNMEIAAKDLKKEAGVDLSKAEVRVLDKARAIAVLEEKINILRGIPVMPNFVENRAIKLKDNMMRNARYNSHNAYSVLEEDKNKIFPENLPQESLPQENLALNTPDNIVDIEANKTAEEVKQMLASNDTNSQQVRDEIVVVPDRDEIKKTLDDEFAKQESEYRKTISPEEVAEVVDQNFQNNQVSVPEPEQISREEVAHVVGESLDSHVEVDENDIKSAVDDALNKVSVSTNGSSKANIERYVNPVDNTYVHEDGTYRLTKEQIDEDFRKTYLDNSPKVDISNLFKPVEEMKHEESADLENEGFKDQTVGEEVIEDFADEEIPFSVLDKNEEDSEQVRLVEDGDDSIKDLTEAVDKVETMDEIKGLLEKIRALQAKQDDSKRRAEEAKAKAKESEEKKREAQERLQAYGEALEEDFYYNMQAAEKDIEKAKSNEALVEAMLSVIQPSTNEEIQEKAR